LRIAEVKKENMELGKRTLEDREEMCPDDASPSKQKISNSSSETNNSAVPNGEESTSRRIGRWTESEHTVFLKGMAKFGRQWSQISDAIPTRTAVQVRTHAQKYLKKVARQQRYLRTVSRQQQQLKSAWTSAARQDWLQNNGAFVPQHRHGVMDIADRDRAVCRADRQNSMSLSERHFNSQCCQDRNGMCKCNTDQTMRGCYISRRDQCRNAPGLGRRMAMTREAMAREETTRYSSSIDTSKHSEMPLDMIYAKIEKLKSFTNFLETVSEPIMTRPPQNWTCPRANGQMASPVSLARTRRFPVHHEHDYDSRSTTCRPRAHSVSSSGLTSLDQRQINLSDFYARSNNASPNLRSHKPSYGRTNSNISHHLGQPSPKKRRYNAEMNDVRMPIHDEYTPSELPPSCQSVMSDTSDECAYFR